MKIPVLMTALALAAKNAGASTVAGATPKAADGLALTLFVLVIAATLCITWWAARKTKSASDFYTAGGNISGFQNGLAIAGDAMSAGALLGLTGLVFSNGFDGLVYSVGYTTGLPLVVFLMAGKLRKLGKYTFTDVVCSRLKGRSIRVFSASASLIIVLFYLVAQMVGAGELIQMLFGIDYVYAIVLVGVLMVMYVTFGGMMATTWVQIVKAVLMISACFSMCILIMHSVGFSFSALLRGAVAVHPGGIRILVSSAFPKDPISGLSLGVALMLGTAGLPHILMRFFTVPDARAARSSVMWATIFMNAFYAMIFIIGFGALYLLRKDGQFITVQGGLVGGGNTAALHLAYVLGGNPFYGFLSAVAFATILAVVSGLTVSGASSVSHDLYASLVTKKTDSERSEMRIMKIAVIALGALAVLLGIAFRSQNIAYMISLAFSISCSSTFPVLILAMYWKRLSTLGALCGGTVGLSASIVLTILGPSIWVKVLGNAVPVFPIDPPALITVPLAFVVCVCVSLLDRAPLRISEAHF